MSAFDWEVFLASRGISFVTGGKSVTKGNLGIPCPMCGDDEGHHMGIATNGAGWYCWRNTIHRGRKPHKLIQALTGCSWTEAARIVGDGANAMPGIADDSFGDHIATLLNPPAAARRKETPLEMPSDFAYMNLLPAHRPFVKHMIDPTPIGRGYRQDDIPELVRLYDLRCALRGPYRYRIVFPIRGPKGLLTWTGRSILKTPKGPRYKALSVDETKAAREGLPAAKAATTRCLWRMDKLVENEGCLVVVEGPFDAMRMDYYGEALGIHTTCLFSKTVTDDQELLLNSLVDRYPRRYLILDHDAEIDGWLTVQRLGYLGFRLMVLPPGHDPGDMPTADLYDLLNLL